MSVTADPATNRISGLSYDANGNVTNLPGVGTIAYDGRNRQVGPTATPVRGYDPSNKKVWWKDAQANLYVDFYGPGGKLGTYQLFMPTNGSAVPLFGKVAEYTYFAGRLVKGEGPWTNGFVQQDRLGSAVTHLPYGEERSVTAQNRLKFATYWREDPGVDYADQRYYSSTYGRFLTSDPYRASGGPSDPGSWNRYAYTRGDPVNFNDARGLADCPVDSANSVWVCSPVGQLPGGGAGGGSGDMEQEQQSPAEPKGSGGGGGASPFFVNNFSRSGKEQDLIKSVFSKIRAALTHDESCYKWLRSHGDTSVNAIDMIDALIANNSFGHGDFGSDYRSIAAVAGSRSQTGGNTGIPVDSAITVNRGGAFFLDIGTIGPAHHRGGTLFAQAHVLVHELAHVIGAAGFMSDFGSESAVKANDALVDRHCGKAIRGLR